MTNRVLRSRAVPVEGDEPADEIQVELPRDPAGRENTRGRGRGRGRGPVRTTRRATTHAEGINAGNRGRVNTRTARRARSTGAIGNRETSHQESSATVRGREAVRSRGRGRNQAFVTHETFAAEMGKLQETLQALLAHQEKSVSGSKDKSESREVTELSSLPVTEVGGNSLSVAEMTSKVGVKGCSYKEFAACKPPIFKGECDPVLVMKWIKEMELVFATSNCVGEDKVTYALSMLRSEATLWWDAETGGSGVVAAEGMSWETFGGMSLREYANKFIEKSRFAGSYVSDEEARVERFIFRLKSNLREWVSAREPTTFQAAVHAAEMTEKEKNCPLTDRVGDKRKWEGPTADPRKGKNFKLELRMGRGVGEKPCGKCHKVHRGDCTPGERSCFQCGLPGHMSRDCPNKKNCYQCGSPDHLRSKCPQVKRGGPVQYGECGVGRREEKKWESARPKGRSFNMTATEAEEVPDVVAGTFLVNSTCARVLFDSGATCSFISPTFAQYLGLKPKRLGREFGVETADANQVLVREVFEGCVVDIEGSLVPVVLYPMPMREFDVVLGMDWLARNEASIICNKKMIRMVLLGKV
ncbi:hypothetical protein L6452_38630 [Arctium lappa]|uniref:Uncharacterized protein n=1 Tax=Arctium lappa TaxID=4217 RepID=A0ACB8XPN1_ARCLA|nr:hypothetical protein L6452_38630 [Arctium lappa]